MLADRLHSEEPLFACNNFSMNSNLTHPLHYYSDLFFLSDEVHSIPNSTAVQVTRLFLEHTV